MFMQKWWRLLKPSDEEKLAEAMLKLGNWLKDYVSTYYSYGHC